MVTAEVFTLYLPGRGRIEIVRLGFGLSLLFGGMAVDGRVAGRKDCDRR